MLSTLCKAFTAQSAAGYKPLACKQQIFNTREMKGTGNANKQFFFFLTKPNTIREKATVDLLYPTPLWLKNALKKILVFNRVTVDGSQRVSTSDFLRIAEIESE